MNKRICIFVLIFLISLSMSSCIKDIPPVNDSTGESENMITDADKREGIDDSRVNSISADEAYAIFQKTYTEAKIKKIEYEILPDNTCLYEIEGYEGKTEYEMKICSPGGEIIKTDIDHDNRENMQISKDDLDSVPIFIEKALTDAGSDYRLRGWELETKNDKIIIEIEVIDGNSRRIEYKYDNKTGDLLKKD